MFRRAHLISLCQAREPSAYVPILKYIKFTLILLIYYYCNKNTSIKLKSVKLKYIFWSLTFRHRASCTLGQAFRYSPENAFYIFILPIFRSTRLCVTVCGIMHPRCCRPANGRQHHGCIIPQAVTHSLVLLKMGKIISRNMLS